MASGRPSSRRQISATAARVLLGQGEVVADGPGSIDEQLHGGQPSQLLDRRVTENVGTVSGPNRVLALGAEPKHRAARGEDLEPRAARERARRARGRHPRPVRGCPARAGSAFQPDARPRRRESSRDPSMPAPTAAAMRGSTELPAGRWKQTGTNTVPCGYRSSSRSPTATASRVLPMPPGPVRVTSRTSGVASGRNRDDVLLAPYEGRRRRRKRPRLPAGDRSG